MEIFSDKRIVSEDLHCSFVSYVQSLTGHKPIPFIRMEHSYARAGGGGAGASSNGTRLLLVRRAPRCPDCHIQTSSDDIVDVETVDNEPPPPLMLEELPYWEKSLIDCDMIAEDDDLKPDWEEKLHSLVWNTSQSVLLEEALTIIHNTRAAFLTAGLGGAKRAAARGSGARALRALLAAPQTRWQPCLAQWLHNALTEHLPTPLLACYREIMLTMRGKVPILVEKMTAFNPLSGRIHGAENGSGAIIASGNACFDPSSPILLLVPSGRDKRDARWAERLRAVAQVHIVHSHQTTWPTTLPVSSCLWQLVSTARIRAEALKAENPHRPIVLVGQGPGASIAIQLSISIPGIAGVVCLGMPLLTADGPRGTPEDILLDVHCPILFVIGQNASNCSQQDAEALRCKLRAKSRLVVAGSADEFLRLPRLKRQLEGVTQRMLESAIAEEVSNFLTFLLQGDEEGDVCSSPESYGGPEGDKDYFNDSAPYHTPKRELGSKMKLGISASYPDHIKKKKAKHKYIKSIYPVRNMRESALEKVNNPPPEGAAITLSHIHNTKMVPNDPMLSGRSNISPSSKRSDAGMSLQITNNRIMRTLPAKGHPLESLSKGSGIKVLENIPFSSSLPVFKNRIATISGKATAPLVLPPKRIQTTKIDDPKNTASVSAANIMDLPIVFADDNKTISDSKTVNQTATPTIRTIVINKNQVISSLNTLNSSGDIKQANIVGTQPILRGVQVKMPLNSSLTSVGNQSSQTVVGNQVKYTKVLITSKSPADISKSTDISNTSKSQVISKPIIVKSAGSQVIKVLQGNIFQKSVTGLIQQKPKLIIKKTIVPSGINMNSTGTSEMKKIIETPKVDGESLRENAKKESVIEAAVASITDEPDHFKDMLGNLE